MNAAAYIGLGILILLLLPSMVAEMDAKRLASGFHAALAIGGAFYALAMGGWPAAAMAVLVGAAYLVGLSAVIAVVVRVWNVRLLTGGHIKMLSASAVWLGAIGGAAMLAIAMISLLLIAALYRTATQTPVRPATSVITALSVIATFTGSFILG